MMFPKFKYPIPLVGIAVSPSRGFSLLELLIVLSISLILVAASVPVINSARNNYRLITARDEFLGTLEAMRTLALKQEMETTITVTENGRYSTQFEQNGTVKVMHHSLPPNATFTLPTGATSLTILCRPTGKVTVTENNGTRVAAITISNPAGQRTITVNLLGHITALFTRDDEVMRKVNA